MKLFLSTNEQGIVIFHVWKSLPYKLRMFLSLTLIIAGFVWQYHLFNFFPGILLVFAGNLLLLVKGYDNRIKLDAYHPEAEWVNTAAEQLDRIEEVNTKIRRWDTSATDITSGWGVLLFLASIVLLIVLYVNNPFSSDAGVLILIADIAVLLYPHWFTGVKRITTLPKLVNKIKVYKELMKLFEGDLRTNVVKYLMLLNGKDKKIPADVKMKIEFKDQPEDFLGMYAQIALNNVQGQDYPYFYVVLVGKESSDRLKKMFNSFGLPDGIIKEFKKENEVQIIVIRQYTTNKSGYYTDPVAQKDIFKAGLEAAKKVIGG